MFREVPDTVVDFVLYCILILSWVFYGMSVICDTYYLGIAFLLIGAHTTLRFGDIKHTIGVKQMRNAIAKRYNIDIE